MIARLLPIPSPGALLLSWQMLRFVYLAQSSATVGAVRSTMSCACESSPPRHCRQNLESSCPSLLAGDLTVRSSIKPTLSGVAASFDAVLHDVAAPAVRE